MKENGSHPCPRVNSTKVSVYLRKPNWDLRVKAHSFFLQYAIILTFRAFLFIENNRKQCSSSLEDLEDTPTCPFPGGFSFSHFSLEKCVFSLLHTGWPSF